MTKVMASAMIPISPTMAVTSKSTSSWKKTGSLIPKPTTSATMSAPRATW